MSREFKISTISQADDAINTVNERLQAARTQINLQMEQARREAAATAERKAREAADRTRRELDARLSAGLSGVSENMKRLDAEQRRRLRTVADNLDNAIRHADAELRADMRRLGDSLGGRIDSLEQRTRKSIDTISRTIARMNETVDRRLRDQQSQLDSHQAQLDSLTATVNDILDRFNDIAARRREAVALARGSRDAAFARTEIQRFCPEEARRIDERINALLLNPDDEATAARAAEILLQIQFAEEEAMRRKMIYDAIHRQAIEQADALLQEVSANRTTSVAWPDDPESETRLETDFWSRGEYEANATSLRALRAELDTAPESGRVAAILEEIAERGARAAAMVGDAARKAILSENRVAITEDIVDALLRQGWQIERNPDGSDSIGYLGGEVDNDWREGVYAVITSASGERISIVVRPDETETDNQIIFHRNDERNITDRDYRRSLQRIKEQIQQSGHSLGEIEAPEGGGDVKIPELADSAGLGRKGRAKAINERVRSRRR